MFFESALDIFKDAAYYATKMLRNMSLRNTKETFSDTREDQSMDQAQEKRYLKKWGFSNRTAYEQYVKEKIEDLEFIAPQLFKIFKDAVREWEADYLRDKKKRFVAETLSPPGDKLLKGPDRVIEKIFESWEQYTEWDGLPKGKRSRKPPITHDPKKFLHTMTDLIRFRIVCNYLCDVQCMKDRIESDLQSIEKRIQGFDKKCQKLKSEKVDHIEIPFPERRAGHRAVQYVFEYSGEGGPTLFEVQVMTQLQHAWDKKDHHLIYEYVRVKQGHKIPLHLKNRMAAMSELLYVADTVFDELLEDIAAIMEKDTI